MGLDIYLKQLIELPQDHTLSLKETQDLCECHEFYIICDAKHKKDKPVIPGLDPKYIAKIHDRSFSNSKMLKLAGIDNWRGWKWAGSISDAEGETDTFHHSETGKTVKVHITDSDIPRVTNNVVRWAVCMKTDDISYMRKGANERFYKDGMWDAPPVCLKATVKEHMMKYFDDDRYDEYFGSPRERFKSLMYDKFKDGKGMCIYYC